MPAAADFAHLFTVLYYQLRAPRKPANADLLAVLGHLLVTGPATAAQLGPKTGIANMTKLLADLLRRKLVDRAGKNFYLDNAGHKFLQREGALLASAKLNKAVGRLKPNDRDQLVAGMRLLVEAALRA